MQNDMPQWNGVNRIGPILDRLDEERSREQVVTPSIADSGIALDGGDFDFAGGTRTPSEEEPVSWGRAGTMMAIAAVLGIASLATWNAQNTAKERLRQEQIIDAVTRQVQDMAEDRKNLVRTIIETERENRRLSSENRTLQQEVDIRSTQMNDMAERFRREDEHAPAYRRQQKEPTARFDGLKRP